MNVCACVCAHAQTDTIRYVHPNGVYSNNGRSWGTATNRLQDAINDLRDYLQQYGLTSGSVYVAAGTYVPTESTESSGGSMLNTSFKIYAGIHVYGGFNPDTTYAKLNEPTPGDRMMVNGKKCKDNWADPNGIGTTSGDSIASQWDLQHATILSGNHTTGVPTFVFDSIRGRFSVAFPASSYHVVWFATNGEFETTEENAKGHFRPLAHKASVDGCVISSGNASTKSTTTREHTAYGGGAYMVGNSELRNCIVERCNATMRGGGIYMDGGGVVEFCKVMQCQSIGVGVVQGYGGGVCIDYDGSIGHSHIMSNAARCGGGLAICHIPDEYPVQERIAAHIMPEDTAQISYYSPFSAACVINNNTANAEGGGIYLANGGTINHATVTANNCTGLDVTYYGRRHGRTGGIYIRNCGMIFNSVFWGNRCETNNDIQFASVRQLTGPDYQIYVYHSAFMNHDISDWTGVQKEMVFSLEKSNTPIEGSPGNFPCFFNPTVDPTDWSRVSRSDSIYGPGVFMHMYPYYFPGPRLWHLTSYSALDQKGVQVTDAVQDASEWIRHAHTDYGVVTNPFEPVSTLGALVRQPDPMTYALVAPQGLEARNGATEPIPTLFINPNREGVFDSEGRFLHQEKEGNSWDVPIRDLGEALNYFRQYLVDDEGGNHHYMIPALDPVTGMATGEKTRYDYVQILVKEGKITTAGPGNYLDRNIRTAAIRVESHMRLYGGYPGGLTGTSTEGRDPHDHVTNITANITGIGGTRGYENNSAHVIAMVNVEHAIVDGFTLSDANTHNITHSHSASAGGGVLVNNVSVAAEKRIDMTGNQLRNCVITNCSSPKGAAVYVNGEHKHADGTVCYAELKMVNCVIRNNMADYQGEGGTINDHGIITANGRAYIEVEHCDVVNNVGYPFKADNKTTETDEEIVCTHPEHAYHGFHGFIRVNNSLIFCNGATPTDNRGDLDSIVKVMSVFPDGQRYVFGEYNMFDEDLRLQVDSGEVCPRGFFEPAFSYTVPDDFLPDGSSFGSSLNAPLPEEKNNQAIFTRTDYNDPTYPGFVNPSRNVGNSTNGDKPLYGGVVSYVPLTTNPCVNAAGLSYADQENYDRTDNNIRNRGGAPDIGALENTDLPAAGAVIYVTPNGAGKRDGSSWDNAIAGNTVYLLDNISGPALATGDQIDPELTCDRVLDSEGNPILTTNEKYNGGWGRVYITGKKTGGTSTTTVTRTWTTETIEYEGGPLNGQTQTPQDDVMSYDSVTVVGSTPSEEPGFEPRWMFDPRYPYGEISGASRSFWRANPYHSDTTEWNNGASYADRNAFITACNANGWINNTRAERYVGGLQYAVERASAANKTYHKDSVQVWVGAGHYTDYKGFVMRDSVTVLGGFPAGRFNAPGMSERQALMSNVIDIPKSKPAANFEAADYETILQISEVNPKSSDSTLNTDAVKAWDNDYKVDESTETRNYEYKKRVVTTTYTYLPPHLDTTEVTSTYIKYANMTGSNASKSIIVSDETDEGVTDGRQYYSFGAADEAPNRKDCWHMSHPNIDNYIANLEDNNTYNNNCSKTIIDSTGTIIGTSAKMNWIMIGNGSLTDLNIWQTMPDVPAGQYLLSIDMACQYKNKFNASEDLNAYFYVLNSNNDTLARTALKAPKYSTRDNSRQRAFRHVLAFTTDSPGDVTIKLVVGDGFRNTKANNATYGTVSGGDTIPIPCYYVGQNGKCEDANKWGSKNPNARELWLSNVHLEEIVSLPIGYAPSDSVVVTTDTLVDDRQGTKVINTQNYTATKERSTLRKRVLTMPDVCVPTYGGGSVGDPSQKENRGKYGDDLSHTDRVWGPTKNKRTSSPDKFPKQEDPHYVEYADANWDGFTIRHGFLSYEGMGHGGGAGVNMYEGGHLRNCIVIDNLSYCPRVKGAGVFCDGATSTIEGCFALNNVSMCTNNGAKDQVQVFAGGMFLYEGTCFNSLFANNYSYGSAGGVGFCVGRFYNNTIAYNTCSLIESGHINGGAISIATESKPNLFVANTIVYGNSGMALRERTESQYQGVNLIHPFINCYIQTDVAFTQGTYRDNIINYSDGKYGKGNVLLTGTPSAATTPFAADFDENGNYVAGRAALRNDFRLRDDVPCVNKGTEDFAGDLLDVLMRKHSKTAAQVKEMPIYISVDSTVLPQNDVAFAKRVQDCQIDMGAYEYNAAYSIRPDTLTHPGKAIFYVTYASPGGDASARSPKDAACAQKLQQILDAAGRYKYDLMTKDRYKSVTPTPVAGDPDTTWTVEVWLAGDSLHHTTSGDYGRWYTATRSTLHSDVTYRDNTLDYSFIVPHGIQIKGGYKEGYFHYEVNGDTVMTSYGEILKKANNQPKDTTGKYIVDDRDPLTYRSVLSGRITASTGAEGNTFHVVTFTNDLFDYDEYLYTEDQGGQTVQITGQLAILKAEKDRAVLDGLFIEDGMANSPDPNNQIGAGAVVTEYAHIRNCVVQNNGALANGGGLYLKPYALVSGTIIKNNTAETGAGIYIETPTTNNPDSLARIFSTTIVGNTADFTGGGMWFENTNVRVNSTVIWRNKANDYANVAGTFTRSDANTDYPLNFCAIESRRLEGLSNVEVSPTETEGVRWDHQDPFDDILYYPIEMSSTLARAGMTYSQWDTAQARFTTLDTIDIAGVSRKSWQSPGTNEPRGFAWGTDTLITKNNDFIEIGARALNKNFAINVDPKYVMHRLYVMHTDLINSVAARALQDNTATDSISNMYRQMGSCMLNPFHRLGDAFDYVIAARKMNPKEYRNRVFEIFIEQGTYYPYHNAYGEQGQVRNNTFLVPEALYIIGGVDSRPEDHHYGQEGYFDPFTGHSIDAGADSTDVVVNGHTDKGDFSYTINFATLDSIRVRGNGHRPMRDNNINSVIEPWELERQTILSGNAVSGEDFTHVYHVVTMHADPKYIGPQPYKFYRSNPNYGKPGEPDSAKMFLLKDTIPFSKPDSFARECDLSILARTTEFDGLQITGGYAHHLDPGDTAAHHYVNKTFYRGGGILVDGNWTETYDDVSEMPVVTQPAKYNIPIIVENCYFSNNMAGHGGALYSNGAIYMFGCHFTQNYTQGPMSTLDQKYMPWSAGGCIATNSTCDISNTLFDNNEARRGLYPIPADDKLQAVKIHNADAQQGFGGALFASTTSRTRVVNCHFMRNKAVAYSAIYNTTPNNNYSDPDAKQYAFNTIFWGNEVFEVDSLSELEHKEAVPQASIDTFEILYKDSRAGVFHYDGKAWARYEKLFHEYDSLYHLHASSILKDTFATEVTDKLAELRAVGDSLEGLYFCSYRKGYGPSGMKPTPDGYLMTQDEQRVYKDSRQTQVQLTANANGDIIEDYTNLFTQVRGNNNVLINRVNTATDGPNFKQPSLVAGIDGYMQNADWLLARMNQTTDQGWGHYKQEVDRSVGYYITKYTGTKPFETFEDAWAYIKDTVGANDHDIYPVSGLPFAKFKPTPHTNAMYNFYAYRYGAYLSKVNAPLPLGDQYYMAYSRSTTDEDASGLMDRISKNPKIGVEDVYIDIGIYEYQYIQLRLKGQEIDTMWVSTTDKGMVHDGLTWETPTTDLQGAIDLLMSSHNNHDKYICFLGNEEGQELQSFSPQNILDNRRTFLISSKSLAPMLPDSAMADFDYGVNSLTFLGGYSPTIKSAERDPYAYPTILEMPNSGNQSQLNQLVVVEDMTRQMLQINWQGEYLSRDSVVIPIVFDGLTFINPYSSKDPASEEDTYNNAGGLMSKKGGAAIYYRWQRRYEGEGDAEAPNFNYVLHPDSALIDGAKTVLPKLTISNCIFMDNGLRTENHAERSSAVRIDHGGGSSLIVNSLFHSNAGAPIYARTHDVVSGDNDLARVPNDVVIVNSTFALNDGHIRLEEGNSEIHNSLIWLDDLHNDTTVQLQIGSDKWDRRENKDRIGIADRVTHNAFWGCFRSGDPTYHNDSLSTDNNDIYWGPGFLEPYVRATTSAQRRERSFRLNPSVRTMNMADTTVYRDRVFFRQYSDTAEITERLYWRRSNGFKSVPVYSLMNDSDLASKPRYSGDGMERGAYECLAVLQRVLYVQPNLPSFSAGDGSSWEKPFGQGQLQNAIDAASVYTYMQLENPNRESRKAYVFVKGSYGSADYTPLLARDGVFVYGSIPAGFNDTAWIDRSDPNQEKFTDDECQRFVNRVRSVTNGVASPNATPTRINSIHIAGDDFTTGFLLDGFVITNPNPESRLASSPVFVDNEYAAVRNCIITNNKTVDVPTADIRHGLLYDCLFYNDSTGTVVRVGENGLVLNNTIVANNTDATALDDTNAATGAVKNNIALNTTSDAVYPFAPYMAQKNPYTLPAYLAQDSTSALNFQLHERSAHINAATETLPAFSAYIADGTVNYKVDRDILGNPRKIGGAVDNGAFETWRVEPKTDVQLTAVTNQIIMETEIQTSPPEVKCAAFTAHYGGNVYPHAGSVVYLMDSSAMTMRYDTIDDFKDFITHDLIILQPGYLLLKPGTSFYGNGHTVQFNYLAAEKRFTNQRYSMTAFPFNYSKENITVTAYDALKDSLSHQASPFDFNTYQYSGAARSAKDYVFSTDNSTAWLAVDTVNRTATEGYLMDFGATIDTVLRFTAFAPASAQYVYTENENDKYVDLTQYDHRDPGIGTELNFTRQEDMGWNMKGLPWLVSDYRTDTIMEEGNYLRQMYIPHVFYQMDGAGDYIHNGGQIYTSRSWDRGAIMSMGNAFLTQTATTKAKETVIFHLPYYEKNKKASRPLLLLSSRPRLSSGMPAKNMAGGKKIPLSDVLTVIPDSSASKNIRYSYGRDGMKWLSGESLAQIYMLDSKRLSRISLLGSAPTEVDIPVGVIIPTTDTNTDTQSFTFSLPEKEAFADYAYVWLIDYQKNKYTNLLDEDYTADIEPGENNKRFAIRIGGFPKTDEKGKRQYLVYTYEGSLHVRGLVAGDRITVYSPSGQLVHQAISSGYEYSTPLILQNGYVVKVNDKAHKVLNM